MYKEADVDQFWSHAVRSAVFDVWNITETTPLRELIANLKEGDIVWNNDDKLNSIYRYAISEMGIYDSARVEKYMAELPSLHFLTCQERLEYIKDRDDEIADKTAKHAVWKQAYDKMASSTEEEKEKKDEFQDEEPYVPNAVTFDETPRFGADKFHVSHVVDDYITDILDGIKSNFTSGGDNLEYFHLSDKKPSIAAKDVLKYEKLCGRKVLPSDVKPSNGIVDPLDKESGAILELYETVPYGAAIKDRVENWVITQFVGSKPTQKVAVMAIYASIKAQKFGEDDEDTVDGS
jgi:hypothetical protein